MAGHHRIDSDQVANVDSCYIAAELANPANGLVPHDLARVAATVFAGVSVKVRAANASGDHIDHHLAGFRHRIRSFLDRHVVISAQYQRLHGAMVGGSATCWFPPKPIPGAVAGTLDK